MFGNCIRRLGATIVHSHPSIQIFRDISSLKGLQIKTKTENERFVGALAGILCAAGTMLALKSSPTENSPNIENTSREDNTFYEYDGFSRISSNNQENPQSAQQKSKLFRANAQPFTRFSIADAVDKAFPALVNIQVRVSGPFGGEGMSAGSGFIFDGRKGLIATNYHVVQNSGGRNLLVTLSNGSRFKAKVHSFDVLTDIAVLQLVQNIDDKPAQKGFLSKFRDNSLGDLPEVSLGDSSNLRMGEWVVALGSPLNMQNSVTAGIVSSVNRHASELGIAQRRTDYIQTDAAINQGNSGGPLINLDGEVVGINTMKVANTGGISFAIPVDTAKIVLSQLEQKGRVDRPYIGLKMMPVRKIRGKSQDIGAEQGVLVTDIGRGSPAHKAGIQPGDLIVSIDGNSIKNTYDVIKILGYDIGKSHSLEVLTKDGKRANLTVVSVASKL